MSPQPTTKHLCRLLVAACLTPLLSVAETYTWNKTAAGTAYAWNTNDNWTATTPGFPKLAGDIVNLNSNLAGAQTITLNEPITLGTLQLGDPTSAYYAFTVTGGTAGALAFNSGTTDPAILARPAGASTVTDVIGANVTLNSPLQVRFANSSVTSGIRFTGVVSGNNGINVVLIDVPTTTSLQFLDLFNENNSYTGDTTVANGAIVYRGNIRKNQNSALGNSASAIRVGTTQTHKGTGRQDGNNTQLRLQAGDDTSDYVFERDIDFSQNTGTAAENGRARFAFDGNGTGGLNTNTLTISGNVILGSTGRTTEFIAIRQGQTIYFTGDISSGISTQATVFWHPSGPGTATDGRNNGTARLSNRPRTYTNGQNLTGGTMIIEGSVGAVGEDSPIGTQTVSLSDGNGGNIFSLSTEGPNRRLFLSTPGATFARALSPASGTGSNLATTGSLNNVNYDIIRGYYGNSGSVNITNGHQIGGLNDTGTVTFSGNISPGNNNVPITGTAAGASGTNVFRTPHNLALTAATGGRTVFSGVISGSGVPVQGSTSAPGSTGTYNNTRLTINQARNHPNLDMNLDGQPDATANQAIGTSTEGTVVFTGLNTYAGGTEVLGGTLLVNTIPVNINSTGTGTGPVQVTAGRLGGIGRILTGEAVTLGAGGGIAPGDDEVDGGMGVFTLAAPLRLNPTGGSVLDFQISRTTSDINDTNRTANLNPNGTIKWDTIFSNPAGAYNRSPEINNDTLQLDDTFTPNTSGTTLVVISAALGSGDLSYTAGMVWALMDTNGGRLIFPTRDTYSFIIDTELETALAAQGLEVDTSRFFDTGMVGIQIAGAVNMPVLAEVTVPNAIVGVSYSQSFTASQGSTPYTFSVTEGTLPTGLTLNSNSGLLNGTPTTPGSFTFTLTVTDGVDLTDSRSITIAVVAEAPSITTAPTLPTATHTELYGVNLQGTGGLSSYTWTVTSGTLPPGLLLATNGLLSGTPTALGTSTFTVRLTDSSGFTDTETFTLNVIPPPLVIATAATLPYGVVKEPLKVVLAATGGIKPYTWALAAGSVLPKGVTLNVKTGAFGGAPTIAGDYTFSVQVTDSASVVQTKELTFNVEANYLAPEIQPITFPTKMVGETVSATVTATNYVKSFKITGLPKGLTYSTSTGVISGRLTTPTLPGNIVKIVATNKGGTDEYETPFEVTAVDTGMVGTFTGIVGRDITANGELGGRLSVTTTTKGSYSAKITSGLTTKTLTGYLAPQAPHITGTIGNAILELTFDPANNLVTGTHGGASLNGWRHVWVTKTNPATNYVGFYNVALDLATPADQGIVSIPQGSGYATIKVAATGALTFVGKTADGQALSSAGVLGPNGEIAAYTLLYSKKGSVIGTLNLAQGEPADFNDNAISGTVTWNKPTSVTRTYAPAFGPLNVKVEGAYLGATAKAPILGLPDFGVGNLRFFDAGLALATLDPDIDFTYTDKYAVVMPKYDIKAEVNPNPTKAALAINKATGAITGSFTLVDGVKPAPVYTRKASFLGMIVRTADGASKARGYFLLPQLPLEGEVASKTPILSGRMEVRQEAPPPADPVE